MQDEQRRVLHSIHVDWNIEGHGLSNSLQTLSNDHLEALSDQWQLGVPLQLALTAPQGGNDEIDSHDTNATAGHNIVTTDTAHDQQPQHQHMVSQPMQQAYVNIEAIEALHADFGSPEEPQIEDSLPSSDEHLSGHNVVTSRQWCDLDPDNIIDHKRGCHHTTSIWDHHFTLK